MTHIVGKPLRFTVAAFVIILTAGGLAFVLESPHPSPGGQRPGAHQEREGSEPIPPPTARIEAVGGAETGGGSPSGARAPALGVSVEGTNLIEIGPFTVYKDWLDGVPRDMLPRLSRAADAHMRLPASWYEFHQLLSDLALEFSARGDEEGARQCLYWRGEALKLDPFLEARWEVPRPEGEIRQIQPLADGRFALLSGSPWRVAMVGGEAGLAGNVEVGDAQPVPAEIPAETSDLSLTLIAGDERPWFSGDDGLYSPDGARHAVEADLSRREFLVPLGYDPGRDTLEVHALCYASGGRFVAVRGQIRVPTPVLFKGTDDNPPRLDDIDTWQTPREGIDIGDPKRIVRGGFEGVLDRESGEVTPYRLWPIHEFPLEVITNLVGNLGLGQDKKTRLFVKYTRSMFIHDRPVPQERLILAVSGDGEYVASVDLATKRLELLRHGPREYGVVLSMENSIPGAKAKANENPCAAFAGRDGRTFLAQQGRELAIWKLDPKPRLLHRQLALPVDWLVVSRDGAEALGVPRGPGWWVDSRLSEGWWKDETDLFIAGLDGDRPQVSDLGTRLGIDVLRPTHMAFESDAATIRVLYVDYDGRLMRQDLPRP